MSTFNAGPANTGAAPYVDIFLYKFKISVELTAGKIREMMANAQRAIAQRKFELGLTENGAANGLNFPPGVIPDTETVDKMRRAAQLQAQINARLNSGILSSHSVNSDSRVKAASRPKRQLSFHEPGKFVKMAQRMRTKFQLQVLQESVAQAVRKTGIASAAKLSTIQPKRSVDETDIPLLEWWDAYILKEGVTSYSTLDELAIHGLPVSAAVNKAWITSLVEHPVKLKPPTDLSKPPEIPLLLTKKERKKLRRQNRQEAQREKQEKVRLGLMPPPEPKEFGRAGGTDYSIHCFILKIAPVNNILENRSIHLLFLTSGVRLANLMRVLGSDAVQDPSKVEAYVRAQMESRKRAHEAANAARKLTKEQARYKRIKKIREDTTHTVHVAVYRVKDFSNPSHRFKVETNANQLLMTGLVALHSDCNVVVVEGGPKQQRKFQRLMLCRIKWREGKRGTVGNPSGSFSHEDRAATSELDSDTGCRLIWKGTVKQRAFDKIQFKACPTELYAREQFRKRDVEHYWDLAYSGAILETLDS
uniref:U4/U6 small nuclear ribonucleoprotein Prp3 n=1 Tax=Schistosoma haematobium TaxID=6185 RepID=A0A094ZW88_SCHHA